ncbi:hypothetical protein [Actinomadura geliboluensis]|uniref:hypothetical protein n=1 Tax=Actinomadura geliboluensis TaxID=882440 RepID=UPI00260F511F|nr:hypothetical protein [Actinomadura geliboluensis]
MGERAHYVIKDGGSWELYYSQWGGYSIELDMLPGPEFAERFARGQRRVDAWMNECECSGAALIDRGERRLLWFSDCLDGPAYRAAALAALRRTWPAGWRLDWAYDGLREIAGAVGQDERGVRRWSGIPVPDDIRTPEQFMAALPQFELNPDVYPPGSELPRELPIPVPPVRPAEEASPATLVTVVRGGVTRAYMARATASMVIENGAASLDAYRSWSPVVSWPAFPDEGVHLDADAESAGVWTLRTLDRVLDEVGAHWPGWRWTPWQDRYHEHLALAAGAIVLPVPDQAAGLRSLAAEFERHQKLDAGTRGAATSLAVVGALTSAAEAAEARLRTAIDNMCAHRPADVTAEERALVRSAFDALS